MIVGVPPAQITCSSSPHRSSESSILFRASRGLGCFLRKSRRRAEFLLRYIHRRQWAYGRSVDDLTARGEPGTVAGTVPDFILVVPLHITGPVWADAANRVELTVAIPVKRDVLVR
jgi:hypothetical protein